MKRKIYFATAFFSLLFFALQLACSQDPGNPYQYLKGYNKYIHGEKFSYESAQPNVTDAMLVRSVEKDLYIEWKTEPVPVDFNNKEATFIFLAAINVRQDDSHSWEIFIDGKNRFRITTPDNRELEKVEWEDKDGLKLLFDPVMIDRHGDVHGYMYLTVPAKELTPGVPLDIKVVGESSDNRAFFIVYRYGMEPGIKVIPEQAVRIEEENLFQQIRVEYTYLGPPTTVDIVAGDIITKSNIGFGYNTINCKIPVVKEKSPFDVTISKGGSVISSETFTVNPVKPRTVYLLHHSHVDIGYTHVQEEVKKIQWEHLENAIRLAEESQNNPEGARFRWNAEVMWAIESYLKEKTDEEANRLKDAIIKGWIEPGATYAHMLSELCNSEELIQVTAAARHLARETGIKIESAMITDVPGWSWGMVPVLANSGVKYLSLGTNHGHRIGSIIKEWGDRPFWWVSESGEEKILCWVHGNGYSMFHTGQGARLMSVEKISTRIFDYMNQLYDAGYPYEIVAARYSVGADNGPTDPNLCNIVMEWNNQFETPKLKISTVSETFSEFEKLYGDKIGSVSGALTGYWEDGAASSAKMTGLNRQAAGNINIANRLAVITDYNDDISGDVSDIWQNIMLYNEHTWGSWNSISDPENPFTLSQWSVKSSFARTAALNSLKLRDRILNIGPEWREPVAGKSKSVKKIEVINSHSWIVTGAVEVPPSWNPAGSIITDEEGNRVPSQLLSTGHIYFIAKDIPPMGSKVFFLERGVAGEKSTILQSNIIENDRFILTVDSSSGAISSLYSKTLGKELVDKTSLPGLNSYQYVSGRSSQNRTGISSANIEIIEDGELLSVIKVSSDAPGCNSLTSYYTLVKGVDKIYITTVTDKKKIYKQEGVHLAFPFNVPDGEVFIDLAFGAYRPGKDQLKGSCMNYYTPERWVDVSNQDYGITLISPDAPLIEIGDITTDATAYGWIDKPVESQTIYSYIMNNYWETNYLAAQEGEITFRYIITPHTAFNIGAAERSAIEESEKLVVIPEPAGDRGRESLFTITNKGIIAITLIQAEGGYLVRLFNAGGSPEYLNISWKDDPDMVWFTDFDGIKKSEFHNGDLIPAWGLRTIRVFVP